MWRGCSVENLLRGEAEETCFEGLHTLADARLLAVEGHDGARLSLRINRVHCVFSRCRAGRYKRYQKALTK